MTRRRDANMTEDQYRAAQAHRGRIGGIACGPTKARRGTAENLRRYWERVKAGEIPRQKRRWQKRPVAFGETARRRPPAKKQDQNATTPTPPTPATNQPMPAPVVVPEQHGAEFADILRNMGF